MLALTGNAVAIIDQLTRDDAVTGVRIAVEAEPDSLHLQVMLVAEPDVVDWILQDRGATVYLHPIATRVLSDMALDAAVIDDTVEFLIAQR